MAVAQLAWRGYDIWAPTLPNSDEPNPETYWEFLISYPFDEDTTIVGHSSGAVAAFMIANRLPVDQRIRRIVGVAGFYRDDGWNCKTLCAEPFDWPKIRKQVERIDLVWAEDDPVVEAEQTEWLSRRLEVEPIILETGGHFSVAMNGPQHKRFPELFDLIVGYE